MRVPSGDHAGAASFDGRRGEIADRRGVRGEDADEAVVARGSRRRRAGRRWATTRASARAAREHQGLRGRRAVGGDDAELIVLEEDDAIAARREHGLIAVGEQLRRGWRPPLSSAIAQIWTFGCVGEWFGSGCTPPSGSQLAS